jgi:hypothetical protein
MAEIRFSPEAYARWRSEQTLAHAAQRQVEIAGWQQAKARGLIPGPGVPRPLPPPSAEAESRWQAARTARLEAQHANAVKAYRLFKGE